jgi:DNA uptake protein ComE-like DNA-binding protein
MGGSVGQLVTVPDEKPNKAGLIKLYSNSSESIKNGSFALKVLDFFSGTITNERSSVVEFDKAVNYLRSHSDHLSLTGNIETPTRSGEQSQKVNAETPRVKAKEINSLDGRNFKTPSEEDILKTLDHLNKIRGEKLNINKCEVSEIAAVPGVGGSLVARIVKARADAPFESFNQLSQRIKGLGPATIKLLERNFKID